MLIKSLTGLVAAAAIGLLSGCGTPCGAPGGLCAPVLPNTSASPAVRPPPPLARLAPAPEAGAQAMPVEAPPPRPQPIRIGLLLPLQSEKLGQPAQAVRDGFMAAWERERSGIEVELIPTGDAPDEVLAAYTSAVARHDVIVGPLSRPGVGAVARSPSVTKPTVALNHPDTTDPLPPAMLAIGLSVEDEARQVAQWAASDFPHGRALVLAGPAAWQQRIAKAFDAYWTQLGHTAQLAELSFANGIADPAAIAELKARLGIDPPELLFAALDAGELRQLRGALGTAIPCYGTSSVNPGRRPGEAAPELDGVRLLDLPWEVQPDHQAVMVYPHRLGQDSTLDMDRLYALGIDAFRVARELALHPRAPFTLDGVTGKLAVGAGDGAPAFERTERAVVYRAGAYEAPTGAR